MARTFADGKYLQLTSAVVAATPLSMAVWVYPTADVTQDVIALSTNGSDNHRFSIQINPGGNVTVVTRALSNVSCDSVATVGQNTWSHICGVWASSTSRSVYVHGANKVSNSTSAVPAGMNRTWLGRGTGTTNRETNGDLAECAIWNIDLTDAEVASLATGISPVKVRPQNLVSYVPIYGLLSPEPDLVAARTFTLVGAPVATTNAPRTRPPFVMPGFSFGAAPPLLTLDVGGSVSGGGNLLQQADKVLSGII